VRVLHAVEYQEERRLGDRLERVLDVLRHVDGIGHRHHALVAHAARHAVEALRIDRDEAHVEPLGELAQVAHAPVVALGVGVDLVHGLGPLAQPAGDRVESDEGLHL
jgi:hypothetical protein